LTGRLAFEGLALATFVAAFAPAAAGADAPPEPAPEIRLDDIVVRVERPEPAGPGAAATVVEAGRFAGEAKSVAELVSTAPGVAVREYGGLGKLATVSIRGAS
jgi:iron complex outermembrane receptor protein